MFCSSGERKMERYRVIHKGISGHENNGIVYVVQLLDFGRTFEFFCSIYIWRCLEVGSLIVQQGTCQNCALCYLQQGEEIS